MRSKGFSPLCFLLCLAATRVYGQDTLAPRVDAVVNAGLACHPNVPGLSVAIVRDGQPDFTQGYGVKDNRASPRSPVNADTVFGIASLSKGFTATLVAKLLGRNREFYIGSNLYKILGRDRFNNTLRSVYATVEDLLAHRMGIPRNNFMRLDDQLTRENLVQRLRYLPSTAAFRKSFHYSDIMYGLLTRITEILGGGTPWEDQLTSELLSPLGMTNTTFVTRVDFANHPNLALPHSGSTNPYTLSTSFLRHWALLAGSGAVMSSAKDMARWMWFYLRGGKTSSNQRLLRTRDMLSLIKPLNALQPGSVQRLVTRPATPVTMSNDGYALGWKTGWYRGYRMIQHTGSTYGYKSMLTLLPEVKVGVFTVMSGTDDGFVFRTGLQAALLDLALGETPWLSPANICSFPSASRKRRSAYLRPDDEDDLYEDDIDEAERSIAEDEEDPLVMQADLDADFDALPRMRRSARAERSTSSYSGVRARKFRGTYKHGAYGRLSISAARSGALQMAYGIGQWNLVYTGSRFVFNATWTGPSPRIHTRVQFLVSRSRNSVYGMKCLACDRSYVPVFYRQ